MPVDVSPNAPNKYVTKILALQRENDIIAMLLDGKSNRDISNYICTKYHVQPGSVINVYLQKAREVIKNRNKYELHTLLSLHIARYEEMYEKLYEMGAMAIAMRALQQKEKLMGFHKDGFHMRVTQGQISAVSFQQVNSEYNIMKLDKVKRNRMAELVDKMADEKKKQKKL